MMQEKIRPGYKQTEIGVIPEDWEIMPFDDVFRKVPSKAYQIQTSEYRETGLFPVIDQGQKRIVGHSDREDRLFKVPAGGVIIFGDHTCIVKLVNHDFIVGADGTQILLPKADHCAAFHNYGLQHRVVEATGYNRHFKFLKQRLFPRPPLREQRAIAGALSDADSRIAALEALIAKKRDLKQAATQLLLTGKTRLPGFSGDWEVKRLGDEAVLKARIGWQGLTTAEYRESGDFVLVTGTEFVDGKVNWAECHFVDENRYKQDPYIQLREKDVLVTKDGTIGKVALVRNLEKPATLNSGVFVIRPRNRSFDPTFFYFVLMSRTFAEFLARLSAGSTIIHLYQKDFVDFSFEAPPSLKEQAAIAEILTDMDAELAALEAEAEKARTIKQGMMQNLLTGKVRLV